MPIRRNQCNPYHLSLISNDTKKYRISVRDKLHLMSTANKKFALLLLGELINNHERKTYFWNHFNDTRYCRFNLRRLGFCKSQCRQPRTHCSWYHRVNLFHVGDWTGKEHQRRCLNLFVPRFSFTSNDEDLPHANNSTSNNS